MHSGIKTTRLCLPKNVISWNIAFLNANVLEACALEIQRSYETNMEKLKVCIVVFTSLSCIKPKTASPKNKPGTFLHDRLCIWWYGACMRKNYFDPWFIYLILLSHRYAVLRDPAGWLSVNPVRGTVNTSAPLDRESPYVHDNKYTALFIATDNGELQLPCWN